MVLCQNILRQSRNVFNSSKVIIKSINSPVNQQFMRQLNISSINFAERKYTDKHEWVRLDGNIGEIGISNYAQEALGDVVFAQLPDIGTNLSQKDECGALESVKAASEIYAPVSGTVTEINTEVESTPGLINTSCYEKGWLFRVKLTKPEEMDKLMNEKQYEEFLKSDEH